MTAAKTERNAAIVAGYRARVPLSTLAARHGMSMSNAYRIVVAAVGELSRDERRERIAASNRRFTQRPAYRAAKRDWAREWWGSAQ